TSVEALLVRAALLALALPSCLGPASCPLSGKSNTLNGERKHYDCNRTWNEISVSPITTFLHILTVEEKPFTITLVSAVLVISLEWKDDMVLYASARPVDQVLPVIEVSVPESRGLVLSAAGLTTTQILFQGEWAELRGQPQGLSVTNREAMVTEGGHRAGHYNKVPPVTSPHDGSPDHPSEQGTIYIQQVEEYFLDRRKAWGGGETVSIVHFVLSQLTMDDCSPPVAQRCIDCSHQRKRTPFVNPMNWEIDEALLCEISPAPSPVQPPASKG
ncbi:hypothetical protein KUCAC02_002070, partial [Chaenocephalus aceratus]